MGGGLCISERDCQQRQHELFGQPLVLRSLSSSAVNLPDVVAEMNEHTRVHLHYCSGDLHAGDAKVGSLHMRGRRIVETVLDELLTKHGMHSASIIVVTGGSAEGTGTYLNADYIANKVSSYGIKVVAVPFGGMFIYPAFEFQASALGMTSTQLVGDYRTMIDWQNQAGDSSCWDAYGKPEPGRF